MSTQVVETKSLLKDEKERHCPPHYLPHKFPGVGKPVTTEPCHFHLNPLGSLHHNFFCQYLECPNYEDMLNARRKYSEQNENK